MTSSRNDLVAKRVQMNKFPKKEEYIDELKSHTKLKDKKIVSIDPNMGDLLYCVDGDTKETFLDIRKIKEERKQN